MLKLFSPLDLLSEQVTQRIARGRCLRSRLGRASCRRCLEACPRGAIDFTAGLPMVRSGVCTGCHLCQAACPTGALGDPELLCGLLPRHPRTAGVIGCSRMGGAGDRRLPCLGILDAEALLALAVASPGGVILDLVRCGECPNAPVRSILRRRVQTLLELDGFPREQVRLAETEADLGRREEGKTISRREFFSSFRRKTVLFVEEKMSNCPAQTADTYSSKRVPGGRRLLLALLPQISSALRRAIEERFFPELVFGSACLSCTGCAGVCPTGAITACPGNPPALDFNRSFCTGCQGCVEFCRQQAAVLTPLPEVCRSQDIPAASST